MNIIGGLNYIYSPLSISIYLMSPDYRSKSNNPGPIRIAYYLNFGHSPTWRWPSVLECTWFESQSYSFLQPEQEIHIMNGLAGCALNQIVYNRCDK